VRFSASGPRFLWAYLSVLLCSFTSNLQYSFLKSQSISVINIGNPIIAAANGCSFINSDIDEDVNQTKYKPQMDKKTMKYECVLVIS
jgi:hypothetical protein